jgi:hypothetical protein
MANSQFPELFAARLPIEHCDPDIEIDLDDALAKLAGACPTNDSSDYLRLVPIDPIVEEGGRNVSRFTFAIHQRARAEEIIM